MKKTLLFSLLPIVAALGCSKPEPALVVLDSWWNIDYAKQACSWPGATAPAPETCILELREFERELATQFAADPTCHALRFVVYDGPNMSTPEANKAASGTHWSLSLNYTPAASKQQWQMVGSPKHGAVTEGHGSPSEIAKTVCAIANRAGATLAN